MSEFVTPIQRYGRTWYKVVLGVSWRFLMWKQRHVTLVNPRELPNGDYPMVWAVPYDLHKKGHDPDKVEKLLAVEGFGGHDRIGIVDEDDVSGAHPDLDKHLDAIFASLGAVPLRGEYIRVRGDKVVPLHTLLLDTDTERQAYRLALRLARQADALKEPTPMAELKRVAKYIVEEVSHDDTQ